ncbi:hypothetical protein A4R44_06267 [Amycolatopsis sp. M39]|nr:hypothetical protein A4R44_06267 [Amycolatopsis sp. M39]
MSFCLVEYQNPVNPPHELAALVLSQAAVIATIELSRAELERQLKASSRNSSTLPSQDLYANPAPKSLRLCSSRGQGNQPGSTGASLKLVEAAALDHVLAACSTRNRFAEPPERGRAAPPGALPARDRPSGDRAPQWHRRRCRCGLLTAAAAPACYWPNVTAPAACPLTCHHVLVARAAEPLADAASMRVSTSGVHSVLDRLAPFADAARDALRRAPVTRFDETGLRAGGTRFCRARPPPTGSRPTCCTPNAAGTPSCPDSPGPQRTTDGAPTAPTRSATPTTRANCSPPPKPPGQHWRAQLSGFLDELNAAAGELDPREIPGNVLTAGRPRTPAATPDAPRAADPAKPKPGPGSNGRTGIAKTSCDSCST